MLPPHATNTYALSHVWASPSHGTKGWQGSERAELARAHSLPYPPFWDQLLHVQEALPDLHTGSGFPHFLSSSRQGNGAAWLRSSPQPCRPAATGPDPLSSPPGWYVRPVRESARTHGQPCLSALSTAPWTQPPAGLQYGNPSNERKTEALGAGLAAGTRASGLVHEWALSWGGCRARARGGEIRARPKEWQCHGQARAGRTAAFSPGLGASGPCRLPPCVPDAPTPSPAAGKEPAVLVQVPLSSFFSCDHVSEG